MNPTGKSFRPIEWLMIPVSIKIGGDAWRRELTTEMNNHEAAVTHVSATRLSGPGSDFVCLIRSSDWPAILLKNNKEITGLFLATKWESESHKQTYPPKTDSIDLANQIKSNPDESEVLRADQETNP